MHARAWIALVAAAFGAGALAAGGLPVASAQAPPSVPSYVCTAVELPMVKGPRSPIPDQVEARRIPQGFRPVGGSAGGAMGAVMGPHVIACREQ